MTMRTLTLTGFLVVTGMAGTLYLLGRARRLGLAPLGDVTGAIRASAAGRLLLVAAWAWVGWHLLAR